MVFPLGPSMLIVSGARPATYVTEQHYTTTSPSQTVSYAGAQAGDYAILGRAACGSATPSGWTLLGHQAPVGLDNYQFGRVLTAGDIATGSVSISDTSNGGMLFIVVYRGASSAAVVSTASSSTNSLVIPGVVVGPLTCGLVTFATGGATSVLVVPAGTTQRINANNSVVGQGVADIQPDAYVDGANMTWPGLAAAPSSGIIIELT